MVVDERSRHALYQQLEATLGLEAANTLMEHLPPTGWADVATRRDLDGLRAEMQGEFRVLRSEMHSEFAMIRTEAAELRADLRGEIAAAFTTQTRTMLLSMFAAVVALGGFILGVARL